jgi:hypothetical protein
VTLYYSYALPQKWVANPVHYNNSNTKKRRKKKKQKNIPVHILISSNTSVPNPSQSRSTLYNHPSTHLPLPLSQSLSLLFLSHSGWLMPFYSYRCFRPLWESQNVRTTVRNIAFSSHANTREISIPNQVLQVTGAQFVSEPRH